MVEGEWIGLGGFIAAVLSAVVSAYVLVTQARAKVRQDDKSVQQTELQKVVVLLQEQVALYAHALREQQAFNEDIADERNDCREELAGQRVWLHSFRDGWLRANRAAGFDPGEVPPLPEPPRKPEERDTRAEQRRRALQQTAVLLQRIDPQGAAQQPGAVTRPPGVGG